MRNTKQNVKLYILNRCVQPKQERDIVPITAKRFDIPHGVVRSYIRDLKQDGVLYSPKKNVLRKV